MQKDPIRDALREGIVKESIQVLRTCGMADEEIAAKMLKSFSITEEAFNRLMNAKKNSD